MNTDTLGWREDTINKRRWVSFKEPLYEVLFCLHSFQRCWKTAGLYINNVYIPRCWYLGIFLSNLRITHPFTRRFTSVNTTTHAIRFRERPLFSLIWSPISSYRIFNELPAPVIQFLRFHANGYSVEGALTWWLMINNISCLSSTFSRNYFLECVLK